jgi:hypothetical protein
VISYLTYPLHIYSERKQRRYILKEKERIKLLNILRVISSIHSGLVKLQRIIEELGRWPGKKEET